MGNPAGWPREMDCKHKSGSDLPDRFAICGLLCSAAGQSNQTLVFPRALLAEMCADGAGAKVASEVADGLPDTRALQALITRLGAAATPVRRPACAEQARATGYSWYSGVPGKSRYF
jgi:hypothetical protein